MKNIMTEKMIHELLISILSQYSGKKLNLMITGGSFLNALNSEYVLKEIERIDSSKWKIYFSDERVDFVNYGMSVNDSMSVNVGDSINKNIHDTINNMHDNVNKNDIMIDALLQKYHFTDTKNKNTTKIINKQNSNFYGAAPFLSKLSSKIFRIEVEFEDAAQRYENVLEKIDIAFLGIGDNGHICSLWPNSGSLSSNKNVISVSVDNQIPNRVTTTLKFVNSISRVYFVVSREKGVFMPHSSIKCECDFITIIYK